MPVGNAEVFPGASFGWLCPRPVSLLADRNVQLSALLNTVSLLVVEDGCVSLAIEDIN